MDLRNAWEVSAPQKPSHFILELAAILPTNSVLFLEGGCRREVIQFLRAHKAEQEIKIARGTIWPKSSTFHIPATKESLAQLASFFDRMAPPEVCIHFHAYVGDTVVLQWHDAFARDPLFFAASIREDAVQQLCNALGCKYARVPRDAESSA